LKTTGVKTLFRTTECQNDDRVAVHFSDVPEWWKYQKSSNLKFEVFMHPVIAMICWLVLGTWLLPAFAHPAEQAEKKLRGSWAATKAERDGKAVDDLVGNRLVFTGNRFQIQSKDGKALYAGTFRVNPSAKPAAIDFEHTEGVFKGKTWKGIYRLDANTLTICDNAPELNKARPTAFEAKSKSGYVLITFKRANS